MSETAPAGAGWAGCRILVTRPAHQSEGLIRGIRARGGEPVAFPTIVIGPPADDGPWRAVAGHLETFHWLLFVSANAVTGFADRLAAAGRAWPAAPGYAAIGAKTAAALEEHTGRAILTPPDFRSESFLALSEMAPEAVAGRRILLVRGEGGRELLPDTLTERGAEVTRLPVYARRPPESGAGPVREALIRGRLDAAVFTSPDTFANLVGLLDPEAREALARQPLVVISPVTAGAVTERGFPPPIIAREASDEGLLEALAEHVCPPTRPNPAREAG